MNIYVILYFLAATAAEISAFSIPKKQQRLSVRKDKQESSELHLSLGKQSPGSELFPQQGSSYVPSGLTKEQWEKIQQKEKGEHLSKDLGAWGPRFQKSERPDGDWMVLPRLWTGGYEVSSSKSQMTKTFNLENKGNGPEESEPSPKRVLRGLLSIVYVYTAFEVFLALSALLLKKKELSLVAMCIMKCKKTTEAAAISAATMWKLFSMNLGISISISTPIRNALKNISNRMQGSTRMTKIYYLLGNVFVAAFASFSLTLLTRFFV